MSTIRFELMRDGLEDHECLSMLRNQVAKLKNGLSGTADPALLARAEIRLQWAEVVVGACTAAGEEYDFDGYLGEPIRLFALRHDIAETLEALTKGGLAKAHLE